jgi:hypothetical protein
VTDRRRHRGKGPTWALVVLAIVGCGLVAMTACPHIDGGGRAICGFGVTTLLSSPWPLTSLASIRSPASCEHSVDESRPHADVLQIPPTHADGYVVSACRTSRSIATTA